MSTNGLWGPCAHEPSYSVVMIMSDSELDHARTEILRAFSKLVDLPLEGWRDLAELVDDQLQTAWAGGYATRARAEHSASHMGTTVAPVAVVAEGTATSTTPP